MDKFNIHVGVFETVYYIDSADVPGANKPMTATPNIAAFDFEGTLVISDRGNMSVRNNQIVPGLPLMLEKIVDMMADGWTIVAFYNRKSTVEQLQEDIFGPVTTFITLLYQKFAEKQVSPNSWRFYFYIATGKDEYRKPKKGSWDLFLKQTGVIPSSASFYCGDAEGKDSKFMFYRWSEVDSKFAEVIGLDYFNPIDVFNQDDRFIADSEFYYDFETSNRPKAVVITQGQAGSGKSKYAHMWRVRSPNMDDIRYYVDNIPNKTTVEHFDIIILVGDFESEKSRTPAIQLAKDLKYPLIAWEFKRSGWPDKIAGNRTYTGKILNEYSRNYQPLTLDEGIDSIIRIN